jgi:phosphotransferase system  glucose/maltose/N-acetylglucosamine-specific IIC component
MNEKGKVLAVLGVVIVLSAPVFNQLFINLATSYIPSGPTPHSQPPIIATAWLLMIPFGLMMILTSIVWELIDRRRRTDTTEIWEQ